MMAESGFYKSSLKSVSLIGNYLPRKCGIATFTTDILSALQTESPDTSFGVIAMNDLPEGYSYPSEVRFEVRQRELSDYTLASDFLNMSNVEVVNLQHEYGIYGGDCGNNIINLISDLRMPVVTTLHTVLEHPSDEQKQVLSTIGKLSSRVVVMSAHAEETLNRVFEIPSEKIVMIHHGIPDVPFVDANYYKDQFGVEGRRVILTFGLLSPGKGIEYMIDAIPEIVKKFPDCVYIILGATHPQVKKEQGESYRIYLQGKARELGVEKHLIFHNRFVELKELCEFIGAADVYVTPYLDREQITSGTLAYSLGAGKAVVSTPYWYAEEMLAEGRGRIVPFKDSNAIAEQVIALFTNDKERHTMRKRAYVFCREMIWKEVSRSYIQLFEKVRSEMEGQPRPSFRTKTLEKSPFELPQPKLDHVLRLTDDVGILQHAKYIVPDRFHGYCTDDNARALIAVMMAKKYIADDNKLILNLTCKYLSFLQYAFNRKNGRFRNFVNYERKWIDEKGSDDSHARSIWALGVAVAYSKYEHITGYALTLFKRAIPAIFGFKQYRSISFSIIGIQEYLKRFGGDSEARRAREHLAKRLMELYNSHSTDEWPWVEDELTWGGGKVAQALIMAGQWIPNNEMVDAGMKMLEWLVKIQTDSSHYFVPVGNKGWIHKEGRRARFDQQPIESLCMIEACREAYNVTRDEKWISSARLCIEWFLGRNDANAPLYDYITGGCCDGIQASGVNQNQGAESTLSCLISLFNMRKLLNLQIRDTTGKKLENLQKTG